MHTGRIADIMRKPVVVPAHSTFENVLRTMEREGTNGVLVVDENNTFLGEVDTSVLMRVLLPDYLAADHIAASFASEDALCEQCTAVKDHPVSSFMNTESHVLRPESPLAEAAAVALGNGKARLPVIDANGYPVGVITRTHLRKIIHHELTIAHDDSTEADSTHADTDH